MRAAHPPADSALSSRGNPSAAPRTSEGRMAPEAVTSAGPTGIEIRGLTKVYSRGARRALDGVDLHIRPGEAFGVIGPNAAGKTTLFGCLLGLLRPSSGTIAIDGLPPDALGVKAGIGYLPERLLFDRWMSGRRFLVHHHRACRAAAGQRARRRRARLRRGRVACGRGAPPAGDLLARHAAAHRPRAGAPREPAPPVPRRAGLRRRPGRRPAVPPAPGAGAGRRGRRSCSTATSWTRSSACASASPS